MSASGLTLTPLPLRPRPPRPRPRPRLRLLLLRRRLRRLLPRPRPHHSLHASVCANKSACRCMRARLHSCTHTFAQYLLDPASSHRSLLTKGQANTMQIPYKYYANILQI